jgi:hypothetical protein
MPNINMTYVRWQKGEPRESRVFPPLAPTHPCYTTPCTLCTDPLGNGRKVQLLALGPEDEEEREKFAQGGWISALAILLHAACIQGTEPPDDPQN